MFEFHFNFTAFVKRFATTEDIMAVKQGLAALVPRIHKKKQKTADVIV